ncbi:MAG: PKD domain-containing protein [Bacteroidales bacterium]
MPIPCPWDFGDGLTADSSVVKHAYTGGEYLFSISVSDTTENLTNIIGSDNSIVIHSLPVIDLGGEVTINDDESLVLDAGSGFTSYLWNDNAGTNLYTLSGADLRTGELAVDCRGGGSVRMQWL